MYLLLEPAHSFLLADAVLEANASPFPFLVGDAEAGSAQNLWLKGTSTKFNKSFEPDLSLNRDFTTCKPLMAYCYLSNYIKKEKKWTHHVEIQAINANAGIVLDAQIDVLLDAKTKVSTVWEVVFP